MTQHPVSIEPEEVEHRSAEDLLLWAAHSFHSGLAMSCSWQKQSSVLVHMAWTLGLDPAVIELDTHLMFRESHETRDRLLERYGLRLIRPEVLPIAEQQRTEGANLWEYDPDRCCYLRKIEPLQRALTPFTGWVTGIRRSQSPQRQAIAKAEYSSIFDVWKIHPLADWSDADVWRYIDDHDIPYHPLHDAGYPSIGCIPCTQPSGSEGGERSGRWPGTAKDECGIHASTSPMLESRAGGR